ncbi:osmoprotectant ABC transporter substrate-binding protein [Streptococcus hyovaginalis]|uniref:osmoprotectant ABC transporter substrate-binding protein n=1 Tax=Streptococcus hyovaginalis TaxID=149015 RepID=UPI000400B9B3|nr:osmoprotectant ABC transporter substrate-binding protein [Streptococcus hyovaginalis]
MRFKKLLATGVSLLLLITLSACGMVTGKEGKTIRIAAQNTTESSIVANIILELINEESDYGATLISNLGSSSVTHEALLRGDADIAATRYTGTDLTGALGMDPIKNPEEAAKVIKREFTKRFDQTWFPTYGFANTYAFMVTDAYAKENNLKTVSDLGKMADSAKAGVDSTWMTREGDGYKEFTEAYGYSFKNIYPMQIGLVYNAVASDKMQVVLGYSTDGRIPSYDLTILEDDKQFFPPYETSMVVNNELLRDYPDLEALLHRLDGEIDLETMQKLNFEVDDKLLEPAVVAKNFLEEHNYFREEGD